MPTERDDSEKEKKEHHNYKFGNDPGIDELSVVKEIQKYHPEWDGIEGKIEIESDSVIFRISNTGERFRYQVDKDGNFTEACQNEGGQNEYTLVNGKSVYEKLPGEEDEEGGEIE